MSQSVEPPPPAGAVETPPPPPESLEQPPAPPSRRGGLRQAWAIVGVLTGFASLIVPGLFALRSYRRWRKGDARSPVFAWVWAWIAAPLVVLGVIGAVLAPVVFPNKLLSATFDKGPGPFTVATTQCCVFDVVDGTYRIRVMHEGSPARSLANLAREAGDVTVTVDVVKLVLSGNDLVGVECTNGNKEGYVFLASLSNGFAIGRQSGSQVTTLRENDTAPIPGPGRIERLGFSCNGNPFGPTELRASINGSTVAIVKDIHGFDSFTEIGLDFSGAAGAEVRFDNVQARVG
jgi:hypothetical protein